MRDWQHELDEYITQVLAMGYSQEEIVRVLLSAGWDRTYVDEGMHRALKRDEQSKPIASLVRIVPPAMKPKLLEAGKRAMLLSAPLHRSAILLLPSASRVRLYRQKSWHAIVIFVENVFNFFESLYGALVRMVFLPFAFAGLMVRFAQRSVYQSKKRDVVVKGGEAATTPAKEKKEEKFPEHILARDIIKLAGRMFRARRLRTFLTILGMSVGIGTILFLVSFGYGIQNVLFERITTAEALLTLDAFTPPDNSLIEVDDALADKLRASAHVKKVSVLALATGEMASGGLTAAGSVYAVDADYLKLSSLRPVAGKLFDADNSRQTIISSAALKLLNFQTAEEAVGKEVVFSVSLVINKETAESKTFELDQPYAIVGVLDDPFSVFAYLPLSALAGKAPLTYSQLKIRVDGSEFLETVRESVLAQGLLVSALSETVGQAEKIFNIIKIILGLFGIITLVVSAIGMLNTMTIALLERTQEVGIMKAVGASNFDIWKLFLAEAMIMGFMGGVGGIIMGFLTASGFNYGINALAKAFGGQPLDLFQSPAWFVLTIIIFSAAVGMITGLWPARRASKLDPLEALKYK